MKCIITASIRLTLVFLLLAVISFSSCKKFLEIPTPKDALAPEQIFENNETAISAVLGIYSRMTENSISPFSGAISAISSMNGAAADEYKAYNVSLDEFYTNEISTNNDKINSLWSHAYKYIYTSNAILAGLPLSKGVSENMKMQIEGEVKFVRAFCYFYLVNLYGEVPLNLITDFRIAGLLGKSSKEKIYAQIIADLTDAKTMLSSNYISTERVRPNKWAAKAMLSRVYLYLEKWDLAAQEATDVIDQKPMYSLVDDLDKVFLKNSTETIWQLMPPPGSNPFEGVTLILIATPIDVALSADFMSHFEAGDNRRVKWVGEYTNVTGKYFYPYKYKIKKTTASTGVVEYSMVIRLAELHLIRAEARAKLIEPELALEDINLIRARAGMLTPLIGLDPAQCLAEVEKQRKFELFSEWGHRWMDLKRTNRAIAVLAPLKGDTWQETDLLYPIPDSETFRNPNVEQNEGYR